MAIGEQVFEFLLGYAAHLQTIHELILWLIVGSADVYDGGDGSTTDALKVVHVLFLNALHFYLILTLNRSFNDGNNRGWLRWLQWIALFISTIDWIGMDTLTLEDKDPYGWFHPVSFVLFFLHLIPVIILVWNHYHSTMDIQYLPVAIKSKDVKVKSTENDYNPVYAWVVSYLVFAGVFVLAFVTGSLEWSLNEISATFPEPLHSSSYWISTILLGSYTGILFFVIFPRITDTKSRPFSWFSFLFMGCVMGVCDALMLAMAYRAAVMLFASTFWSVTLLTFVIYLVPTAYYYAAVFNPKLAPEHRRPEWDLFKILSLTLSDWLVVLFACYWHGWFFVFLNQALVLAGIVSSMRFPQPW